ncbi:30S ribosomal protein S3 [Peptococcus simiae]|uniref:30S ribosomal protein S3 n=1 Tax=Peptococcus simiae TaxID=1643805 RepID=UPI0039805636
MGQKVNPIGMRVGVIRDWDARWYADDKNYVDLLHEDFQIREFVKKKLFESGVSSIIIERTGTTKVKVTIHTAKPGIVIGKNGSAIEVLRAELEKMTGKSVSISVMEVKRPEADAQLIAESIAEALVRRISFRRAIKQALQRANKAGVKGIKVAVSGRLGGADIARTEWATEGKVPLHTLRADIDYGFYEADTTYGKIGVKVWTYKGEVLPEAAGSQNKKGGR